MWMQPASTTSRRVLTRAVRPCCNYCPSASASPPRRAFSQEPSPPPPAAPREVLAEGTANLAHRRLIAIAGVDAPKFLQGLVTGNLLDLSQPTRDGPGFYTAFLNAQGRLKNDVFIYRDTLNIAGARSARPDSSFLIEVDHDQAKPLMDTIRRYQLRSRFDVRPIRPEEASISHVWSSRPLPQLQTPEGETPGRSLIRQRDDRGGGLGWRIVTAGPLDAPRPEWPAEAGVEDYHVHRYLRGVAEGQAELHDGQALPLESNLDLVPGAIDWHKGCYVGQELTVRTKHRGVVRKRVLPCVLYRPGEVPPNELTYRPEATAAALSPGADINSIDKKGRTPGKWLQGIGNIGLALCRLESMTELRLIGAERKAEGYQPGDEFSVMGEGGQEFRVKAFVPPWLRREIATTWAAAESEM